MDTQLQSHSPEQALQRAIRAAGGAAKLAAELRISRPAVAQWSLCPALRVLDVERLTGISRHDLRPDLYPAETVSNA